jgi:hypothetical protein
MRHCSNQFTNWLHPCALIIAVLLAFAPVSAKTTVEQLNEQVVHAAAGNDSKDAPDLLVLAAASADYGSAIFLEFIHETNMAVGAQLFLKALRLGVSNIVLYYDGEFYLRWTEAERAEAFQLVESHFQKLRPRHPFLVEVLRQERYSQATEFSRDFTLKMLEVARESGKIGSPLAMGIASIYQGSPTIEQRFERKVFCAKLLVIGVKLDKTQCSGNTSPPEGERRAEWLELAEDYETVVRSGVSDQTWKRYSKYCEFIRKEINRPAVCGDLVALLDLACTLRTTNPDTARVNDLPMCDPEFEMKIARSVGELYKQVFDIEVLHLKDQTK